MLTELLELQAFFSVLFVLPGLVIQIMADRAFQVDKIILGHFKLKIKDLRLKIFLGVREIQAITCDPICNGVPKNPT